MKERFSSKGQVTVPVERSREALRRAYLPPSQQQQVRVELGESLQGVISPILPTTDRKGRVAALEIMVAPGRFGT
jgi:Tfp pilus assembly pilus retraction ATPase PilT